MLRRLWTDVRYRLRAVFGRSAMEEDLDAELRFHLEREAEELQQRRGVPPAEARRLALAAFGGVALGAEPERVARTVLGESAALCAVGLAVGIPIGLAAVGLIHNQIFGVGRLDVPSLATAVAILILTTLVAAYLPARRAARVAPLEALRGE